MSSDKTNDAAAEYLRELELRLTGLPVLQRRELLAEIEAHIASERAERGVTSESDLLELLERLGSPEVVAAAAYEEAGMSTPREPVLSYAGARAVVRPLPPVPPPDAPPSGYSAPFPPAASFDRSSPYAGSRGLDEPPAFDGPPPVAGPPFAPPPVRRQENNTGLRVVIAAAIVAVVVVLLGCLAGGFMLTRGSSVDEAPAVRMPAPTQPVQPARPTPPTPTRE